MTIIRRRRSGRSTGYAGAGPERRFCCFASRIASSFLLYFERLRYMVNLARSGYSFVRTYTESHRHCSVLSNTRGRHAKQTQPLRSHLYRLERQPNYAPELPSPKNLGALPSYTNVGTILRFQVSTRSFEALAVFLKKSLESFARQRIS